jgi:hypothetical protein
MDYLILFLLMMRYLDFFFLKIDILNIIYFLIYAIVETKHGLNIINTFYLNKTNDKFSGYPN